MRVAGEVVSYERRDWRLDDGRSGQTRLAKVQESRDSIVEVRFPDSMPEPRDGDLVDLIVRPEATPRGAVNIKVVGHFEGYTTPHGADFLPAVIKGEPVSTRSLATV